MDTYCIYGLAHPVTKQIHYVGLSRNPKARFSQHLCHAKKTDSRMVASKWIASLLAIDLRPELVILEEYQTEWKSEALAVESQWTEYCKAMGEPLLNKLSAHYWRRFSRILPGRQPSKLRLDSVRGWYYVEE